MVCVGVVFPTSAAWLANGRSPRKSELPFNIRLPFTNIKSRCLTEAPVFDNPMQKRKKYDFSLPEEPTLIYQPTQSTKILSEPASRWKKNNQRMRITQFRGKSNVDSTIIFGQLKIRQKVNWIKKISMLPEEALQLNFLCVCLTCVLRLCSCSYWLCCNIYRSKAWTQPFIMYAKPLYIRNKIGWLAS